jgi:hypothetical protein
MNAAVKKVKKVENKIAWTYNICGVYDKSGKESFAKVRIAFANKKLAHKHERDGFLHLLDMCRSWLNIADPGSWIKDEEFDLDCQGEYESADNNDIIEASSW